MTVAFDQQSPGIDKSSVPVGEIAMPGRPGFYRNYVKRVFDIALVIVFAPIILPVMAALVICVASDGGRPIYLSRRVGRNGRTFGMLKLRTMVKDADAQLEAHLREDPEARTEWDATQKLKNDPRITGLGHFLRKSSLDELPQVWNILVGDMSIVGPRPMLPEQREIYPGLAYYALRPGLTGPWQVSARNESEFADRASFDRDYEKNISLHSDIALIFKTVGAVLGGTGY